MSSGFTSILALRFLLPLLSIAVIVIAIIICLDCIWRVEKRLDLFLKVLVSGLVIELLRMIARIAGFADSPQWIYVAWTADFLSGIVFLVAMMIMYKMIRSINHERPKSK